MRFFVLDESDRLLETEQEKTILLMFSKMRKQAQDGSRLQVCFFSATLHTPAIKTLASSLCEHPTWVDLKGKDFVPETVHHLVVECSDELMDVAGDHFPF